MTTFDWATIKPGIRVRANFESEWFPAGLGTVEEVSNPRSYVGPEVRVTWDSGTKIQNLTWLVPSWFTGGDIVAEEPVNIWEELELM